MISGEKVKYGFKKILVCNNRRDSSKMNREQKNRWKKKKEEEDSWIFFHIYIYIYKDKDCEDLFL